MAAEKVLQLTSYEDAKVVKALDYSKSIGAVDTKLYSQY